MDYEFYHHRVEQDAQMLPGRENRRTRGTLFFGDRILIHLLEDEVRIDDPTTSANEGAKIKGRTAIPAGRYEIRLTPSPKYKRAWMPEITGVPGFTGIRVHSGHDEVHTEGCLLTAGGFDVDGDIIAGSSRPAMKVFEDTVVPLLQAGHRVFITITNDFLS